MSRNLPEPFLERMVGQLADEYDQFLDAITSKPVTSLRLNPRKNFSIYQEGQKVPWCPEGRYLAERPVFAKDPHIFSGAYYVQEASSMFLAHALRTVVPLAQPLKVLDLCAAPGGKTTLISSLLAENSLLVSNELVRKRALALQENVVRWGDGNIMLTTNNPENFAAIPDYFDVVVVDAPCSGEGMFRKDPKVAQVWTEAMPGACAFRQRQILEEVVESLAPGGWLFYSTCTFAAEENEENISWLVNEKGFSSLPVEIFPEWGVTETKWQADGRYLFGYRFYPHKVGGEGFFMACLRKKDEGYARRKIRQPKKRHKIEKLPPKHLPKLKKWVDKPENFSFFLEEDQLWALPSALAADYQLLSSLLQIQQAGIVVGKFKNEKLIPAHHLAMSHIYAKNLPIVSLSYEQAIDYLRKQELNPQGIQHLSGWALVSYQEAILGWIKILPGRVNNYFPMDSRLRKEF